MDGWMGERKNKGKEGRMNGRKDIKEGRNARKKFKEE